MHRKEGEGSGCASRALGAVAKHRRALLIIAVAGALLPTTMADGTFRSSRDALSTRRYLNAVYALMHQEVLDLPASKLGAQKLIDRIGHECRGIANNAPRNMEAATLSLEIGGALTVVMRGPDRAQMERFSQTVKAIRWHDQRIRSQVREYARKVRAEAHLKRIPSICDDFRAWVSSDFRRLARDSLQFVKNVQMTEVGPEAVSQTILRRYEQPDEHRLLGKISNAEKDFKDSGLRALADAWVRLGRVLGLLVSSPRRSTSADATV